MNDRFYNLIYSLPCLKVNVDEVYNFLDSYLTNEFLSFEEKKFLKDVLDFINTNKSLKYGSYLKLIYKDLNFKKIEIDSFESFKSLFLDYIAHISYQVTKSSILNKIHFSNDLNDLKSVADEIQSVNFVKERSFEEISLDKVFNNFVSTKGFYKFYVKELDDIVNGLLPGTVLTIAGWVAHGKSSFVYNMVYKNMREGRDSVILALEIPKEVVYLILLSRHICYDNRLLIPYGKILRNELTDTEFNHLKKMEEDFKSLPGKVVVLTLSEVGKFTKSNILNLYESLDSYLNNFSSFFIDHVNIFKYVDNNVSGDYYIKLFTEIGTIFKNKRGSKILTVFVAQVNREGYKKANRREGLYDLTALSDFNELERSSTYVLFIYANELMIDSHEMKVDLKKNRVGKVTFEPIIINYDPLYSLVGVDKDISSGIDFSFGGDLDKMFDLNF